MQLNKFEKEFKEQVKNQPVDFDLDQSWGALNERLDDEFSGQKKKSVLGRWGMGIFLCLLLGYCANGLLEGDRMFTALVSTESNSVQKENQSNRSTASLAALNVTDQNKQPWKRGAKATQSANITIATETTVEDPTSNPKIATRPVKNEIENNSNHEVIALKRKEMSKWEETKLNRKRPNGLEVQESHLESKAHSSDSRTVTQDMSLAKSQTKSKIRSLPEARTLNALVPLEFRSKKLRHHYTAKASIFSSPIQINRFEKIGSFRGFRLAGGWSKPYGKYISSNSELSTYLTHQNKNLKYLEALNLSLAGSFTLAAEFAIELGVQFQQINQVLEFSRQAQVQRTLENVVVEIRINPYTQDSTFIPGTVQQEGQIFQSVRHYNAMTRWSVPLKFEYLHRQNRWGFGLAIGTSFSFSHVSRGRFIQTDGTISNVQVRHPANVHFFSLEPIITLALGQPFVLDFRPHFQQAINNGTVVHSVLHRPQFWGLDIGLRYEWGGRGRRLQLEQRF